MRVAVGHPPAPGYERLMEHIKVSPDPAAHLIVESVGRLTRQFEDSARLRMALAKRGISLIIPVIAVVESEA